MMKMFEDIIPNPNRTFEPYPPEAPSLLDLAELIKTNPAVSMAYNYGIKAKISHEQILILIIQCLAEANERLIENNRNLALKVPPKPVPIKQFPCTFCGKILNGSDDVCEECKTKDGE